MEFLNDRIPILFMKKFLKQIHFKKINQAHLLIKIWVQMLQIWI